MVGVDTATIGAARKFMAAFESPIYRCHLAVQTRHTRIHMEHDPNIPDCLRVRNVPAIEPGETAHRAPVHPRMQANSARHASSS